MNLKDLRNKMTVDRKETAAETKSAATAAAAIAAQKKHDDSVKELSATCISKLPSAVKAYKEALASAVECPADENDLYVAQAYIAAATIAATVALPRCLTKAGSVSPRQVIPALLRVLPGMVSRGIISSEDAFEVSSMSMEHLEIASSEACRLSGLVAWNRESAKGTPYTVYLMSGAEAAEDCCMLDTLTEK